MMKNFVESSRSQCAYDLQRDAQYHVYWQRPMSRDPILGRGAVKILTDANKLVLFESEIKESGDVDMIELFRCQRFGFKLRSDGVRERPDRE